MFCPFLRSCILMLTIVSAVSHHMSAVSSSCSETARTSVPVSWPRSGYVFPSPHWSWHARKLTNSQLGTFGRAKAKVDELQRVIAESRRAGH